MKKSASEPSSSFGISEWGLVLLLIYNLIFFLGKFGPETIKAILSSVFAGIQANQGAITLLELLGIVAVFIDLVIRFDAHAEHPWLHRRFRVILTGIVLMSFFFKVFINYLDSAYLTT